MYFAENKKEIQQLIDTAVILVLEYRQEEMMERRLHYHMKIRLFYEECRFGPGVADLMKLVEELGSLSAACKEMKMSYSKAWKIIKAAQDDLGIVLMEGSRGGERGGQTVLAEDGKAFLEKYTAFEQEAREAVGRLFETYYGETEE